MNKEIKRVLKLAKEFLFIPSSIFNEYFFLKYLNDKLKNLDVDTVFKDDYLVAKSKKKNNSNLLICVHVDRHSVIKNEKDELEYLAFYLKNKEGIPFKKDLIEESEIDLLKKIKKDVKDIEVSLTEDFFRFKSEKYDLKFRRIGTSDFFEKVALRYVNESIISFDEKNGKKLDEYKITRFDVDVDNNKIVFQTDSKLKKRDKYFMIKPQLKICEDYFYGQIDNVISVAVLFYLIENGSLNFDVIFTTKEEIGESYKCVIDYLNCNEDEKVLVLDTSPYNSFKDYEKGFLTLRKGDERGGFDDELTKDIRKMLDKNNIPYHYKPSFMGTTELGQISLETKGKINGATLQLPSLNYHTNYETATVKSLENYIKAIKELNGEKK